MSDVIIGAWSEWDFEVEGDALNAYEVATSGNDTYQYGEPFTVSIRATSVDNMAFLALVTYKNEDSEEEVTSLANVHITTLSGKSELVSTNILDPEATNFPGGWSSYQSPVDEDAKAEFEKTKIPLGCTYELLANTSQVVAGLNYAYLAKGTQVVPEPTSFAAIIRIFVPLYSDPDVKENQLLGIQMVYPTTLK